MILPGEEDEFADLDLGGDEQVETEHEETVSEVEDGQGEGSETEAAEGVEPAKTAGVQDVGRQGQQLSRGSARIQQLANQRREAEEKAKRLEEEVAQLRIRQQTIEAQSQYQMTAVQQQRQQEELAHWWNNASPEQRMQYQMQQMAQQQQQFMLQQQRMMAEQQDVNEFKLVCASNKVAAKLERDVEQAVQQARARGIPTTRVDALNWLVGQKVLAGQASGKSNKGAAQARVTRQTVPARSGRGDTPGGRARSSDSVADFEAKFGDVPI